MNPDSLELKYRASWLAMGWLMVAVVVYLTLSPSPPKGPDFPESDKLMHGLTYLVLTAWFGQLYSSGGGRVGWALAFAAMGGLLEVVQGLGEVRTASWADAAANAAGAACGWLLLHTRLAAGLFWVEGRLLRAD